MRLIYSCLFTLLIPVIFARLYWRGRKIPGYRQRWGERLANYSEKYSPPVIWIHAVSVGEFEAAIPLIKKIQQNTDLKVLVTTTTPTASTRVQAVLQDSAYHVYFPYDVPWVVDSFLTAFQPKVAIFLEKEIWPNIFAALGQRQIPLVIINARLSARSARGYQLIAAWIKPALQHVTSLLTQTTADRDRFIDIGAATETTKAIGNIKFDVSMADATVQQGATLRRELFPGRYVWIIASTHPGEDEIFLDLYAELKQQIPELILLLVPRHPDRAQSICEMGQSRGLETLLRSGQSFCKSSTDVYIADTIGELKMLYAAADLAFVAGSMVPIGGHNILEPLALGKPTLFGPHMHNFEEIAAQVLAQQAALQCLNSQDITTAVKQLYHDAEKRQALIANGNRFMAQNQGATEKVMAQIKTLISL